MEQNRSWGNPDFNNLTILCKELSYTTTEKNIQSAKNIIQKIFNNKSFDLGAVLPSPIPYNDQPFSAVYELTNGYSPFFDTVIDDDELCDDLWNSILYQCDSSCMDPQTAKDSVLMNVISTYVTRMLPCDESVVNLPQRTTTKTHQTIKTPLQLFKSTSPLVNRMSIEDRNDLMSSNVNLQPRFINIFCNLVLKICSTSSFPTPNRLLLLRYLLKQFHVFCLYETFDEYIDTLKNAIIIQPPFMAQLYNFFHTTLLHCPTVSLFKDITMCWLTYCRPWRYHNIGNPTETIQVSKFVPFAKKNFEFYRTLLGKIIKKFSSFNVTLDITTIMRSVIEFSWKEPQCIILRSIGLDVQPHVVELLEHMKTVVLAHKNNVRIEEEENSGILSSLFGNTSSKSLASAQLIKEIENMMRDCDKYLATRIMNDIEAETMKNETQLTELNKTAVSAILSETPKTGFLLPDHFVDSKYNLMLLTPNGKKQVLNGERRFNFSRCTNPNSPSATRMEISCLVPILTDLSQKASNLKLVKKLSENYSKNNAFGYLARLLMYPPFPNPDPTKAVPIYSPFLKETPPLLRLRIFANFLVVFSIIYMILAQIFGKYFIIPTMIIGFIGILVSAALAADS